MNKIKTGIFTTGDETTASVRYRALAYSDFLRKNGFDIKIFYPPNIGGSVGRLCEILRDITRAPAFDIVFIQKKCYPPLFAKILRKLAKRIVFDFDDAIYLSPPDRKMSKKYERNFSATIKIADGVICGNSHLENIAKSYNPNAETTVLPTGVDTQKFSPTKQKERTSQNIVIGWVGYSDNHIYLKKFRSAWQVLNEKYPSLVFRIVSDKIFVPYGVNAENIKWELAKEAECFDGIDIGVMPLEDSEWARGKCAFKAIQYMACGIPVVASAVGENINLVKDGETGFLAKDDDEWIRKISVLIEDADLREKFAREGRKTVEEKYSLNILAPRLSSFLKSVLKK